MAMGSCICNESVLALIMVMFVQLIKIYLWEHFSVNFSLKMTRNFYYSTYFFIRTTQNLMNCNDYFIIS